MTRYAIVPVEATDEMVEAALHANMRPPQQSDGSVRVTDQNAHIWQETLAAAPNPLEDAELVERVAMAFYERYFEAVRDLEPNWSDPALPPDYWDRMRDATRAAIAAIGGK